MDIKKAGPGSTIGRRRSVAASPTLRLLHIYQVYLQR